MRIVDFLDKGYRTHPERIFCIDAQGQLSYAQAHDSSHRIANVLLALGAGEGSKVSIYAPNCGAVLECIYGMNRMGATWVPLNARNGLEENLYILESFEVDIVLYDTRLAEMVAQYMQQVRRTIRFVAIDGPEGDSLRSLCQQVATRAPNLIPGPEHVVSIIPTGGTTGKPKGVMHNNLNWIAQVANVSTALPPKGPVVHLVVAPLTHGAGAIAAILTAQGATHVILDCFDAEKVMRSIEQHGVTHLFLPPTALYALLAHPDVRRYDYSSLQYFLYGAAPAAQAKIEEAISVFGPVMTQGYGQTEAPTACTFLAPDDHRPDDPRLSQRMRSCGRPGILTQVRIITSDGQEAEPMQAGEIEVRGALVMVGYYNNPAATQEAKNGEWLRTGDVGYLDQDGYLYIVDRSKDMIISGGFNIYPSEIEAVVCSLGEVEDCAVIGVPDEKWGEAVKLVVQLKKGRSIDQEVLLRTCREQLGGVKTPKSVEIWDDLPRSATGKVLKREIRNRFWLGAERRV